MPGNSCMVNDKLSICMGMTRLRANTQTLAAGLAAAPGRPLVNSVNGEEQQLADILPVVKEFGVPVIGLVIDDDGISMDPEKRLSVAGKIIDRAAQLGIPIEDMVIDPLAMAVSTPRRCRSTPSPAACRRTTRPAAGASRTRTRPWWASGCRRR